MSFAYAGGSRLAAIGTWSSRLLIVTVPELKVIADHDLATTVIPRSTLFMDIGDERALLLGMGDGQLSHWRVRTHHACVCVSLDSVHAAMSDVTRRSVELQLH